MALSDWLASPFVQQPDVAEQQPGFLELLSRVAGGFYGGFQPGPGGPQYGQAAGALNAFGDFLQNKRQGQTHAAQAQQIGTMFPEMAPLLKTGLGVGDAVKLADYQHQQSLATQQQKQIDELARRYSGGSLAGPPTQEQMAAGITGIGPPPHMSMGDFIRATNYGIKLPKEVIEGGGALSTKFPTTNQTVAASIGLVDENGQPRPPQSPQEWKALADAEAQQGAQRAVGVQQATQAGKRQEEIDKLQLPKPDVAKRLKEWDIRADQATPEQLTEAREAVSMDSARAKRAKESKDILDSANKALEILPKVVKKAAELKAAGYSDAGLGWYADNYEAIQTPSPGLEAKGERLIGQLQGIPSDVKQYLNLVGSLRNSLMKAYAAQIPSRAASFIKGTQIHVPAMRSSLGDVADNAKQVTENLLQAKRYADPSGDPDRKRQVEFYMKKYGFKRSYAEYRVDKLDGLAGGAEPGQPAGEPAGTE